MSQQPWKKIQSYPRWRYSVMPHTLPGICFTRSMDQKGFEVQTRNRPTWCCFCNLLSNKLLIHHPFIKNYPWSPKCYFSQETWNHWIEKTFYNLEPKKRNSTLSHGWLILYTRGFYICGQKVLHTTRLQGGYTRHCSIFGPPWSAFITSARAPPSVLLSPSTFYSHSWIWSIPLGYSSSPDLSPQTITQSFPPNFISKKIHHWLSTPSPDPPSAPGVVSSPPRAS